MKRECMSDRVKQVLIERILNGTYQPGERLVELQIARDMETSQAPVREALRELEAMRLVDSEPYRGTRVREVSLREMQESYQVRGELEALAARLAASKFHKNPQPLQVVQVVFRDAALAKDWKQLARQNAVFHRLIIETSSNSVLLHMWDSLNFEAWTRINLVLRQKKVDPLSFVREHQEIIDALVQNDGDTAAELLRKHAQTVLTPETQETAFPL
ncbi:MAG: GntR family transcriptional regulator [Iphinoe sp. HA4291-MV1]|jgi:DNA-binding GntR family transcriptional regulator|nr:GntR family transcriptional regulator [Iphinoe sp. HA4291-MV1]